VDEVASKVDKKSYSLVLIRDFPGSIENEQE